MSKMVQISTAQTMHTLLRSRLLPKNHIAFQNQSMHRQMSESCLSQLETKGEFTSYESVNHYYIYGIPSTNNNSVLKLITQFCYNYN